MQDQLIHTYHNQVVQNADFHTQWSRAMNKTPIIKNDDGLYKSGAFPQNLQQLFNHVASAGRHVATGGCLLHYMRRGKKKPATMSLQSFFTCIKKALHAVKLLDCCYEKELDNEEAKILFFYSFPKDHIQDYVYLSQRSFDNDTLKDLKNFFQGHATMLTCPRKTIIKIVEVKRVKLSFASALV